MLTISCCCFHTGALALLLQCGWFLLEGKMSLAVWLLLRKCILANIWKHSMERMSHVKHIDHLHWYTQYCQNSRQHSSLPNYSTLRCSNAKIFCNESLKFQFQYNYYCLSRLTEWGNTSLLFQLTFLAHLI